MGLEARDPENKVSNRPGPWLTTWHREPRLPAMDLHTRGSLLCVKSGLWKFTWSYNITSNPNLEIQLFGGHPTNPKLMGAPPIPPLFLTRPMPAHGKLQIEPGTQQFVLGAEGKESGISSSGCWFQEPPSLKNLLCFVEMRDLYSSGYPEITM